MLRALVLVLVLANLGLWAWREGWFAEAGFAPVSERDPSRLAQQLRPEAVRVLAPGAAAAQPRAAAPGMAAPAQVCLEAGPFGNATADAAEQVLAASLPAGSWQRNSRNVTARYGVVLGPFASREALQKKIEEIGRLKLAYEEIALTPERGAPAATLGLGLALAQHDSRAAAEAALASLTQRGVRTARVAQTREAGSEIHLRIDAAAPALAEQVRSLSGAALGAGFAACADAPPPR